MAAAPPGQATQEVDATGAFEVKAMAEFEELEKQHEGLMSNISMLKEEVEKWQEHIEAESKAHSQKLDDMRSHLRQEVESLRSEFEQIKHSIKVQIEEDAQDASPSRDSPSR